MYVIRLVEELHLPRIRILGWKNQLGNPFRSFQELSLFLTETERNITKVGLENCASKLHPPNSILMTSRASIGFFAVNKVPVATNQGFIVIEPKREIDSLLSIE